MKKFIYRKQTRKILSIMCVCMMVTSLSLSVSAQGATTSGNYYKRLMILQENAVAANEALNVAFGCDAIGNITFPDDFAGARIEGNKLVLSLTDVSDETKEKYENWVGEYAQYLLFEEADFSYNQLRNTASEVAGELMEDGYTVTQYYVSETENELVVGISFDNLIEKSNFISINNTEAMSDTLSDEHNISVRIDLSEPVTTASTTLRGGANLSNTDAGCSITLSCCGYYEGSPAIVTCGHGGQSVGDTIKYASSSGNTIGTVNRHNYYDGCTGDFEIIKVADSSTFSISNSINNTYSITNTTSSAAVNTVLKYYSRQTSSYAYGTVNERGVTVLADNEISVSGLSSIKVTNGSCVAGDSGAPFFQEINSGVSYCGVLHGHRSTNGYLYVYFTPYTYLSAAGFTALVNTFGVS